MSSPMQLACMSRLIRADSAGLGTHIKACGVELSAGMFGDGDNP